MRLESKALIYTLRNHAISRRDVYPPEVVEAIVEATVEVTDTCFTGTTRPHFSRVSSRSFDCRIGDTVATPMRLVLVLNRDDGLAGPSFFEGRMDVVSTLAFFMKIKIEQTLFEQFLTRFVEHKVESEVAA